MRSHKTDLKSAQKSLGEMERLLTDVLGTKATRKWLLRVVMLSCFSFFYSSSPTPFSLTFISQGRFLIKLLCLFNNTLHFALLRMEWVIQHWPHQRTASFIFDNKKNIFHHNELNRKTRVTASSVGGSWNGRNYHVSRVRFNTVFHFALLLKITV